MTIKTNYAENRLLSAAFILAALTVFYNVIEGVVSVYFGLSDETLSLFGFGADSFVEVLSGIGIWHMLYRLKKNGTENKDKFEKTALKITGTSFYLLTFALLISSGMNIYFNHKPSTTIWGIIISVISIITMGLLIKFKLQVGRAMNSKAIIADANCTKTCMYLSIILLISSIGYELTHIGIIDSLGALGIAYYSVREGRESFEKAKLDDAGCTCGHDSGN